MYYFSKALKDIEAINSYVSSINEYEQFMSDNMLIDAIMFRLVQLIENIKNISEEYRKNHPSIPWGNILGFRNKIVHEYGKTDYTIVYEVVTKNLPELKVLFEGELLDEKLFNC